MVSYFQPVNCLISCMVNYLQLNYKVSIIKLSFLVSYLQLNYQVISIISYLQVNYKASSFG